jgi:gluconate 2-dehydrogenase subunit 3-like protein
MKPFRNNRTRRAFLLRAAAGAGAVAGTSAGPVPEAAAQNHTPAQHSDAPTHGAFFNQQDAATVAAFTERLMPGAEGKPGAREAGVLNYIDLALSGAYADLQDFYRSGLAQLDQYCRNRYHEPFARLDAARQDEVITALEQGKAAGFTWPPAQEFFNTLRTHTMEGLFADPIYGGNKDFAGWRLVGFPGAQAIFTPADLESRQAFTREPIIGLQAVAGSPKRRA